MKIIMLRRSTNVNDAIVQSALPTVQKPVLFALFIRNLNRSNAFVFAINVKEATAMILALIREKRAKFLPSKH